ncbi:MAG: type III-B CRISPR module RAMP protein Cmr4 [Desulfamplus sp.]
MYRQTDSKIMALYAISPVHAGSGSSMGIVDLPIQRERHTNWPHIQSSGVKGAMRHHFEKFKDNINNPNDKEQIEKITEKIFGDENYGEGSEKSSLPGAIAVSDAKILAFPIRSSKSPFVWITCPAVLKRVAMDINLIGKSEGAINITLSNDEAVVLADINKNMKTGNKVLLEDYEVAISDKSFELSGNTKEMFKKADRLLLVSDEVFNYGVSHCTEIRTQIKIDDKTGTTSDGSLRYAEVLPADTLMYVVMFYGQTRNLDNPVKAGTLIEYMKDKVIRSHIQIGGDETLGCGLFEIEWI